MKWGILVLIGFFCTVAYGQRKPKMMSSEKLMRKVRREERKATRKHRILILPSIYYTPETRLAGGLSAFGVFKTNKKDTVNAKTSKVIAAAIYTAEEQIILSAPYNLFLDQDRIVLSGRIGFFKYPFKYSGLGSNHPVDASEDYDSHFFRARVKMLRKLSNTLYLGGQYWYQNTTITAIKPNGLLDQSKVSGYAGSTTSGLGTSILYDSRTDQIDPHTGWFTEFSTLYNAEILGSNHEYNSYILDARHYIPIAKTGVLASQVYSEFHFGTIPFNQLALTGGQYRLRGYTEGIFRDKKMVEIQSEYRSKTYFNFLSYVLFVGAGTIGEKTKELGEKVFISGGGGLRLWLDMKQKIFVRLDYGIGDQTSGFYVNLGHTF